MEERDQRPPKTTDNSSILSGQQPKAKRGLKKGHLGTSRTTTAPDVVVEVRVESCAACRADLRMVKQEVVGSSQVVDLPLVRPVVIETYRCEVCCPACRQTQTADYPAGLEAERAFGPRLEAVMHYLHLAHLLSYVQV